MIRGSFRTLRKFFECFPNHYAKDFVGVEKIQRHKITQNFTLFFHLLKYAVKCHKLFFFNEISSRIFFRIFFNEISSANVFLIFFNEFSSGIFFQVFFVQNHRRQKIFTPDAPTDLGDFSFFALSLIECKRQITCYVWGGGVKWVPSIGSKMTKIQKFKQKTKCLEKT